MRLVDISRAGVDPSHFTRSNDSRSGFAQFRFVQLDFLNLVVHSQERHYIMLLESVNHLAFRFQEILIFPNSFCCF